MAKYLLYHDYDVGYILAKEESTLIDWFKYKIVDLPESVGEHIIKTQEEADKIQDDLSVIWRKNGKNPPNST